MGGGEITASEETFLADGVEHKIDVARQDNIIVLNVDRTSDIVVTGPASAKQLNLGANPELHIGGIPKDSGYYGYV